MIIGLGKELHHTDIIVALYAALKMKKFGT
jgi:hypothetical protein